MRSFIHSSFSLIHGNIVAWMSIQKRMYINCFILEFYRRFGNFEINWQTKLNSIDSLFWSLSILARIEFVEINNNNSVIIKMDC